MNGRLPVAVVALALVVAGLAGRVAVRTLQTARHGDARDFAILYTGAHLYRAGTSFYDPGMDHAKGVNASAALVEEAARLGTLHAHEGLVHIHAFSYPPLAVLPFVPFTALSWRHAVEAWLALSVVLLVAAFLWITRAARRRGVHGAGDRGGRLGGDGGVRHAGGAAVRLRPRVRPARQPLAHRLDRRHGPRALAVGAARCLAHGRRGRLGRGPGRGHRRPATAGPDRAGAPRAGALIHRARAAAHHAEHHDQSPRLHAAAARRPRRRDAARRLDRARRVAGARHRADRRHRRLLPASGPRRRPPRAAGRHQDVRSGDPDRADAPDAAAAAGGGDVSAMRADAARIFVTALLVYVAFWNPWLQFSNSDNFVDGAVSLVDTGRWELVHWRLYEGKDTATARDGRVVPGVPFGTSLVIAPVYTAWRLAGGARVEGWTGLETVNAVVILLLCAPAMALTAVQVAWLAGWLGASRRGRVLAALLFALGTQAFQFGTMLTKESLTALALAMAVRLALVGGAGHRASAGALAGAAVLLSHSVVLLPLLLGFVVLARSGRRAAAAFAPGRAPFARALGVYDTWLFGAPWRTSYSAITGLQTRFVAPKPAIVADFLVGPRGGLFLYSPFLLTALAGLAMAWRGARRAEAALTVTLLAALVVIV